MQLTFFADQRVLTTVSPCLSCPLPEVDHFPITERTSLMSTGLEHRRLHVTDLWTDHDSFPSPQKTSKCVPTAAVVPLPYCSNHCSNADEFSRTEPNSIERKPNDLLAI